MPSAETVLNKPLSGEEVKRIILAKISDRLSHDTRLADYLAFPSFQFRADLAIVLTGAVVAEIKAEVTGGVGTVTDNPDQPATVVTSHVQQDPMPPNEARLDAGLGIPILASDGKGRLIEKDVKYSREQMARARGQGQGNREGVVGSQVSPSK